MRTALIVEDNSPNAELFYRTLKHTGFSATIACNGFEALEYLAVSIPDLVLLDVYLPGMSGLDVLRYIRQEERLNPTRVMIATAHQAVAADVLVRQADLFLLKPLLPRDLALYAGQLLDRP